MVRIFVAGFCLLSLAACGGGGGGGETEGITAAPISNGLPFANNELTLEDFRQQSGNVTVVRHLWVDGEDAPRIVIEEGKLVIDAFEGDGPLANVDPTMTVEIGGETLEFVDGRATDSNGRLWSAYIDTTGKVSGTAGIYHYDYGNGADAFDTEGVFAFGFLTDPGALSVRSGTVSYKGDWFGYGVVTDGGSNVVLNEAIGGGALVLTANLSEMRVSGRLMGSFDAFGRVDSSVGSVGVNGNSFAAGFGVDCDGGAICSSNSVLGGAFYGGRGQEVSGAIGFDETRTQNGQTRRLVSSAGYTAFEQ